MHQYRAWARAESRRLLYRLHALYTTGRTYTQEAKNIREDMDECYRYLTVEDVRELSQNCDALQVEQERSSVTDEELNRWQTLIELGDPRAVSHQDAMRLIREVRTLRQHLSPTAISR